MAGRIFTLLPADARGRACCVCRGWRAVLADPSLWSCLVDDGLRGDPAPLLLGASRRACGLLHRLNVSCYTSNWQAAYLEVATANADSLHELRVGRSSFSIPVPSLEALVRAAPNLQVLEAHPWCAYSNVMSVMPPVAIGTALAAIVAADAPALRGLELHTLGLGDDGLAPIVNALPQNHHLLILDIGQNGMSEEFARNRLLSAVRANTSLYLLCSARAQARRRTRRWRTSWAPGMDSASCCSVATTKICSDDVSTQP